MNEWLRVIVGMDKGLLETADKTLAIAAAWLDDDGQHVWFAHDCNGVRDVSMLPWPTWQALPNGDLRPSIVCDACGFHEFGRLTHELADGGSK